MAIITRIVAVTVALGGSSEAARPQAVRQADVRGQSLTVAASAGQLSARAVIHGDNKRDAADTPDRAPANNYAERSIP
ncbi:MAG: hypothetical protein ACT4R6_03810 [Gemmatimonadaceae bacterium]